MNIKTNKHAKKNIKVLQKGDCFGTFNFFTGLKNELNALSNDFSTIIQIKRSNFINLIK